MGGLFSQNDFVQRLTRPEYFPIATSPQNPHHTAIPLPLIKTIQLPLLSHSHTSPPQIPKQIPTPQPSSIKISPFPPISPTLSPFPTLLSTLSQKTPHFPHKFHYFQPKISQISQNFSKINKIHTKKSPQFPHYHTSIPQNGCKNTFLKTSQTHLSKSHTHAFIAISLINRLIHNSP